MLLRNTCFDGGVPLSTLAGEAAKMMEAMLEERLDWVQIAVDNGFSDHAQRHICLEAAAAYRRAMHRYADMPEIDIWFERTEVDDLRETIQKVSGKAGIKRLEAGFAKALNRGLHGTVIGRRR